MSMEDLTNFICNGLLGSSFIRCVPSKWIHSMTVVPKGSGREALVLAHTSTSNAILSLRAYCPKKIYFAQQPGTCANSIIVYCINMYKI